MEANIREMGYLDDSILLVSRNPNGGSSKREKDIYFVHDGNTRTLASLRIPDLDKLPCRVVTIPEGIYFIILHQL